MNCISSIQSAIKAKSPIVAVSVAGHAPFCLKRKLLAGWAKRVTIISAEFHQDPDSYYTELEPLPWNHQGPANMVLRTVTGSRMIKITGRDGNVRTTAKFIPVARHEALEIIRDWSDKERKRMQKKIMLGALGKEDKKALKLAALGDEGLEAVSTRQRDGKIIERQGLQVSIPELPEFAFYAVMSAEKSWTITESVTGKSAGRGSTAEKAIIATRESIKRIGVEAARAVILKAQQATAEAERLSA